MQLGHRLGHLEGLAGRALGSGLSDSEGGQHEHRGSDPTSLPQWDAERPSVTPSGCNPTHSRLQPYVPRLQPYLTCRADHPLRLSAHALNGSVVLGLRPRRQQRGGGRGAGQAALAGGGFVPMWKAGLAQISANWLSAGRLQRQLVIQAAPKPRPASASLGQSAAWAALPPAGHTGLAFHIEACPAPEKRTMGGPGESCALGEPPRPSWEGEPLLASGEGGMKLVRAPGEGEG